MDDPVPTCEECAACCTGGGDAYVPVTGDDHARLGADAGTWTHFAGTRCFMRMENGRCAALYEDARGRRLCAIYERRPATCRDLERGSPACAAERLRKLGDHRLSSGALPPAPTRPMYPGSRGRIPR